MATRRKKAYSFVDVAKIVDAMIPDAKEAVKKTDSLFYQKMVALNNEIKVRHEWGFNRTFNLRQLQYIRKDGLFKVYLGNTAKYASPLHDGSKAHTIEARRKKALTWVAGGERHFAKKVQHPGIAKRPWINMAWDRNKKTIMKAVSDLLTKLLSIK